jgi:hypothetical protein
MIAPSGTSAARESSDWTKGDVMRSLLDPAEHDLANLIAGL